MTHANIVSLSPHGPDFANAIAARSLRRVVGFPPTRKRLANPPAERRLIVTGSDVQEPPSPEKIISAPAKAGSDLVRLHASLPPAGVQRGAPSKGFGRRCSACWRGTIAPGIEPRSVDGCAIEGTEMH
jgi:hypothetical protein